MKCKIGNCQNVIKSRGWCNTHYTRWRKYGNPLTILNPRVYPKNSKCTIQNCDNPIKVKNLCSMHYTRWRRTGDPLGSTPRKKKYDSICSLSSCDKEHHSYGWCASHYKNWTRYGDPLITYEDIRTCCCEGCNHLMPKNCFWCDKCFELILNGIHPEVIKSKSGWLIDAYGYIQIYFRKPTNKTNVKQHKLVMEKIVNRNLNTFETVHHKNGDRQDNRPENLELWCKGHTPGQRVEDKVNNAIWVLSQYAPDKLCRRIV